MTSTATSTRPTTVRRLASTLNAWTLWAFNTQDVLNPHRRAALTD